MQNPSPTRLFAFAVLFTASLHAQTHRVEASESVTRSVGVYEWTGELAKPNAARLIPVSVFIEGKFQDGGTYYARPIPLALLNGNIYSLEKSGIPQGTITLDYARHLQTAAGTDNATDLGWFGYGTYATMPAERKAAPLRSAKTQPAIVSSKDQDDDRPTFANKKPDTSKADNSKPAPTPDSKTTTTASTAPDDPDRPRLSKPASSTPSTPAPASDPAPSAPMPTTNTTTTREPDDDSDRPTLRRRDPKQAEADRKANSRSTVTSMAGSLNDDPDRPNMRHGKTAGIGGAPATQLTGIPAGLHQMVAVSDPKNREPHPFAREFATAAERAEVLSKLQAIAQTQLAEYVRINTGAVAAAPKPAAPKPGVKTAPRRPAPAHIATPAAAPLSNEELTGYTLSYGGLPTYVYTAISIPTATLGVATTERYVTLVTQLLPSGEMQLAFSSVTDAAHLDRTPWFRPIDAVDPDVEHRASILFELRGHSSRQFALYRILSAKAEELFVTNPVD